MRPILFSIGEVQFASYTVLLIAAFLAGILVGEWEARGKEAIPPGSVARSLGIWVYLSGITGARLLFILLNWSHFSGSDGPRLPLWESGVSFHGGLGAAILALFLFCKKRKIPFWQMTDVLSPAVFVGYAVARIGCFLNGCCYGGPTSLPWGIRFPLQDSPHLLTPPSHPTQLYAAAIALILAGVLMRLKRYCWADGQIAGLFFILYSIYRFGIEFLRRGATAKELIGPLTQAQVASLGIILLGAWIFWGLGRRARPEPKKTRPLRRLGTKSAR